MFIQCSYCYYVQFMSSGEMVRLNHRRARKGSSQHCNQSHAECRSEALREGSSLRRDSVITRHLVPIATKVYGCSEGGLSPAWGDHRHGVPSGWIPACAGMTDAGGRATCTHSAQHTVRHGCTRSELRTARARPPALPPPCPGPPGRSRLPALPVSAQRAPQAARQRPGSIHR